MTNTLINEDTSTTVRSSNPLGSYLDARERSKTAYDAHKTLFDTDAHIDRVAAVCEILERFFGHPPSYLTYRGLGTRRPFENIKVANVGHILSRISADRKNDELYKPLLALGNVTPVSKNGHLTIRVY